MAWDSWTHVSCKKEQKFMVKEAFQLGGLAAEIRWSQEDRWDVRVCVPAPPLLRPEPPSACPPHLHNKQDIGHDPCLLY